MGLCLRQSGTLRVIIDPLKELSSLTNIREPRRFEIALLVFVYVAVSVFFSFILWNL